MRRYFISFFMMITAAVVFAQGQKGPSPSFAVSSDHKETSASFTLLNNQPAVMVVLPYAPATVTSAMQEYEVNCYKAKRKQSSAYVAFDQTDIMKNNKKGASLVFHIGAADNQRPDQTVVYMLLNSAIDKGDYAGTVHRFDANEALAYLDNLAVAIQAINLDWQIKANMAKLKKEEQLQDRYTKRCDRLSDRREAMQQKIAQNKRSAVNRDKRLSDRLTANQNTLALHKATIEKQRADLTNLANQKKSFNK